MLEPPLAPLVPLPRWRSLVPVPASTMAGWGAPGRPGHGRTFGLRSLRLPRLAAAPGQPVDPYLAAVVRLLAPSLHPVLALDPHTRTWSVDDWVVTATCLIADGLTVVWETDSGEGAGYVAQGDVAGDLARDSATALRALADQWRGDQTCEDSDLPVPVLPSPELAVALAALAFLRRPAGDEPSPMMVLSPRAVDEDLPVDVVGDDCDFSTAWDLPPSLQSQPSPSPPATGSVVRVTLHEAAAWAPASAAADDGEASWTVHVMRMPDWVSAALVKESLHMPSSVRLTPTAKPTALEELRPEAYGQELDPLATGPQPRQASRSTARSQSVEADADATAGFPPRCRRSRSLDSHGRGQAAVGNADDAEDSSPSSSLAVGRLRLRSHARSILTGQKQDPARATARAPAMDRGGDARDASAAAPPTLATSIPGRLKRRAMRRRVDVDDEQNATGVTSASADGPGGPCALQ